MRKLLIVGLLAVILTVAGCAKEAEARGKVDICETALGSIMNECNPANHEPTVNTDTVSDKRSSAVGVGLDLIFYEDSLADISYKVTGEYKYDWANGDHSAYAVVTLKLMDFVNKIRGK